MEAHEDTSQTVQKNRLLILPSYCYQPISETLVLSTAGISILLREERKKKKRVRKGEKKCKVWLLPLTVRGQPFFLMFIWLCQV